MGKGFEKVIITNYVDIANFKEGLIKESAIRTAEVEALVDTGAAMLCLPPDVVEKLGLLHHRTKSVRTANCTVEKRVFAGAEATIRDRTMEVPVMENDRTTPALIGYLVLETLDFVVDPKNHGLMPNPDNDGKWIIDLL